MTDRQKGLLEAAEIASRMADKAQHRAQKMDTDSMMLELSRAGHYTEVEREIRKAARRKRRK